MYRTRATHGRPLSDSNLSRFITEKVKKMPPKSKKRRHMKKRKKVETAVSDGTSAVYNFKYHQNFHNFLEQNQKLCCNVLMCYVHISLSDPICVYLKKYGLPPRIPKALERTFDISSGLSVVTMW